MEPIRKWSPHCSRSSTIYNNLKTTDSLTIHEKLHHWFCFDFVAENIWQYKYDINLSKYSQIRSLIISVSKMEVHINFLRTRKRMNSVNKCHERYKEVDKKKTSCALTTVWLCGFYVNDMWLHFIEVNVLYNLKLVTHDSLRCWI